MARDINEQSIQSIYENFYDKARELTLTEDESAEVEQTLVLVKPDAFNYSELIESLFTNVGLEVIDSKVMEMTEELVKEHYSHLVNLDFFPRLRDFMMEGPIYALILQRKNAIEYVRGLIGPTDSTIADSNTIRGMFGTDKTRNAVHASDSVENALIEIERFFGQQKKLTK